MSRDRDTLFDIAHACRLIGRFTEGVSESDFLNDPKTRDAVLLRLLVIGEAVGRLSDSLLEANPQVPWTQIRGMRNRVIHGYDQVDLSEVWRTIVRDLPQLHEQVVQIGNLDEGDHHA